MKQFCAGFLSVLFLSLVVLLPFTSCNQLKDSTQQNTTNTTTNTSFGDFDIL